MSITKFTLIYLLVCTYSVVYAQSNKKSLTLGDFEKEVVQIVKKAKPCVVRIVSCKGPNDFHKYSGIIINGKGLIATVASAVDKATKVCVKLKSGKMYQAKIIGKDEGTYLALLKVDANDLPFVAKGDSSQLREGSFLFSFGSPYGLPDKNVTMGIASSLGRTVKLKNGRYLPGLIQTTAIINPGEVGGLVVDTKAQFVGMIFTSFLHNPINLIVGGPPQQGIHFILPSNTVQWVVERLEKTGKVSRGWIGMIVEKKSGKFVVVNIQKNSPAGRNLYVKTGDILVAIDDLPVKNAHFLLQYMLCLDVGKKLKLEMISGKTGAQKIIHITTTIRPNH